MVGTPTNWLEDLMTAGVHEAGRSAPSSGALPSCGGPVGSLPLGAGPEESPSYPHCHNIGGPKEEEATMQKVTFLTGPSEATAGPSGTSVLLMMLHRDHTSPAVSLNSNLLPDP